MIWRSAIVAAYVALAIVIGVAYGTRGLTVLFYYYFCAGAWVVFALVWGSTARRAGRWNVRRLETAPPRRERNGSGPGGGEPEAVEQPELGAERQSLRAPSAKRRQPAPVL